MHYGSPDSEWTRWMLADQDRAHLRPTEWESSEPVLVAVLVGKRSERHSVVSNSLWPWNPQARILEWGAIPFSRGSSQPRDWTQVSHIVGKFFTNWATWEARVTWSKYTWRTYNCAQHIVSTQRSCDYVLFGKSVKNNRKYAIEGLKLNLIWSKEARANWIITCQSLSV